MSQFQILVSQATGSFPEYMRRKHGEVARAATQAIDVTLADFLAKGRDNIAQAGFPVGHQRALRGIRYPRGKSAYSANAAMFVWHRSPYMGVFERGATITGRPLLWIPLSSTIPKLGRQKVTPKVMAERGIKLVSLTSRKGTPLLGTNVSIRTKREKLRFATSEVTWTQIKNGQFGDGPFATIPLFFGVSAVSIPKKLNILGLAKEAERMLPSVFVALHKDDE